MSQGRASLRPEDTQIQKRSSLRSKLRNISINRNKAAHFEEEKEEGEEEGTGRKLSTGHRQGDEPHSPIRSGRESSPSPFMEQYSQTRGRSHNRQSSIDSDSPLEVRPVTASSSSSTTMPTFSQPQLASPILSRPSVGAAEQVPEVPPNEPIQTAQEYHDNVTAQEPGTPVVSQGFLSSVFNVASNLGTVLGTGTAKSTGLSLKSVPTIDSSAGGVVVGSPYSSTVGNLGTRPRDTSIGTGDLSLRDMGLSQVPSQHEDVSADAARPRAASQPMRVAISSAAETESEGTTRPARSGSIAASFARKRRGSNATSIFSGADGQGQKITGFAVASNKRNREFHSTFRSVPDADYLLDGTVPHSLHPTANLWSNRLWLCSTERDLGTRQNLRV